MICELSSKLRLQKYNQVINNEFSKGADFMDKITKNLGLDRNSKILYMGPGFGAVLGILVKQK